MSNQYIAVLDTETNYSDAVMSIGIVIASADTYQPVDSCYYVISPAYKRGGMFSNVLFLPEQKYALTDMETCMDQVRLWLDAWQVECLFAYNARFDYSHLPALQSYAWFDIMKLAAYRQYNKAIQPHHDCCKTGRLKRNYGVEPILRLLSRDFGYQEVHNALEDARDELKIMELLGHDLQTYELASSRIA